MGTWEIQWQLFIPSQFFFLVSRYSQLMCVHTHTHAHRHTHTHVVHTDSHTCAAACFQTFAHVPHTNTLINKLIIFRHQFRSTTVNIECRRKNDHCLFFYLVVKNDSIIKSSVLMGLTIWFVFSARFGVCSSVIERNVFEYFYFWEPQRHANTTLCNTITNQYN